MIADTMARMKELWTMDDGQWASFYRLSSIVHSGGAQKERSPEPSQTRVTPHPLRSLPMGEQANLDANSITEKLRWQ
jgi:hypothetical protein